MPGEVVQKILLDNTFYRPHIQLDCQMIQALVKEQAFARAPVVVGDIGVRLGFDRSWDLFTDQCLQVGFEPDGDECARIRAEYAKRLSHPVPRERIENIALWDSIGTRTLYLVREPTNASCFPPNQAFFRRLPDATRMHVMETREIPTTTLDCYHEEQGVSFDVLKLDVQGGELPILRGGVQQLRDSVLAVVVEVEFVELYAGQPLFPEIDHFMREQQFSLFDLDICRWRHRQLPKTFEGIRIGRIVWANALYLKEPLEHGPLRGDPETQRIKLLKLAALAEFFSLPDYAIELLAQAKDLGVIDTARYERLVKLLYANRIVAQNYRNEFDPMTNPHASTVYTSSEAS